MESKFFSARLNALLLACFMFFSTALHEEKRILLYLCATVAVSIVPVLHVVLYPKLSVQIINSKFFLWITFFMCFIMLDASLRTQYSEFQFDYAVFVWATICIFLVILYEFDNPSLMIKAFCKACLWSLIAVIVCIVIMEKDSIIAGHIRIGSSMSTNNVTLLAFI